MPPKKIYTTELTSEKKSVDKNSYSTLQLLDIGKGVRAVKRKTESFFFFFFVYLSSLLFERAG